MFLNLYFCFPRNVTSDGALMELLCGVGVGLKGFVVLCILIYGVVMSGVGEDGWSQVSVYI